VAIELVGLDHQSVRPTSFIRWLTFSNNDERNYVAQMAKMANNEQVKIFLLQDGAIKYGFVALSINILGGKPCIVIKYIFASLPYRGKALADLGGLKLGDYFLGYVVNIAEMFSSYVSLRYIALQPASDALAAYYKRKSFVSLDPPDWMFLRI